MNNDQICVWGTRRERWDSFLNDPELALAIEKARSHESSGGDTNPRHASHEKPEATDDDEERQLRIGARLRAYETPITDEILRQSIR